MTDDAALRESLVAHISGFKPAVTGTLCDGCSRPLREGDDVQVMADHSGGAWHLVRTHCASCPAGLSSIGMSAVVECEVGYSSSSEWKPLHNPTVVSLGIDDAARGCE